MDIQDLVQCEVQGLRGFWVCSQHKWEKDIRFKPSWLDRGGVSNVADPSGGLMPGPGGKPIPGGRNLVWLAQTVAPSSYAKTSGDFTNYSNGDLTVEVLVFIHSGSASSPKLVTSHADFFLARGWVLYVTHGGTDPIFFMAGTNVTSLEGLVTPDVLHRLSVTKTSSGSVVLYVDGVSTATGSVTSATQTYSAPLSIGSYDASVNPSAYAIGDLRIFNVVRTPAEIAACWNASLPPNTPGLVASYPTGEGQGVTLEDIMGGESMTITGGLGWLVEEF